MLYEYTTTGVCSKLIRFEMDGEVVRNVSFEGGCSGNLQGVSRLAEGRKASEVVQMLSGISCSGKATSCPDQLARALSNAAE